MKPGETIDFFPFPSFGQGNPVTYGGDVIAALTTNPGVKEFVQCMTTPEAGTVWAGTGAVISTVKAVGAEAYKSELAKREAQQLAEAEAVRFDGSDLLPAGGPDLGALLQNALRGEDAGQLLTQFQQEVKTAWENE